MSHAATSPPTTPRASAAASGRLTLPIIGAFCALLLIIVGGLLASQRDEELPTLYGHRRGSDAGRSVNGTAVLADLFRQRGNRVTTMTRLSPRVNQFDVLVWVPNDFKPPNEERREWLEEWLKTGHRRTVVYVGRDYNAAIDYWKRMVPETPPSQADEALHRQAEARAAWESARSKMPTDEYVGWFAARRDAKPLEITDLGGPWADGIDAKQTHLHLEGRLAMPSFDDVGTIDDPFPPAEAEPLLMSDHETIAFRLTNDTGKGDDWSDGQIIVLANGSFVLNYSLVNHEHRKLAMKLVDECATSGRNVVFLESGPGGPKILKKEPTGGLPTALELLKVWPLNSILLHLAVLGMVLCLSRWPIFGRPRELPSESSTDFGQHIAALGKLLARTKDRNYAHARLVQYRQLAERRSGRSHAKSK